VLPGCEIKIDHEEGRDAKDEGEILFRGRHIMMGYMKNPEKTAESIDDQGWLHSGDVGKLDSNGFLHITGRIKELIITAGGENVAPVRICCCCGCDDAAAAGVVDRCLANQR
jgi:long-chain-fatty-acid--CoA ligase ACSBG